MLLGGGLVLWFFLLYVVLCVLSGVLVLALAWYGFRAVHACVRGLRAEPPPPLHPSQLLTPAQARRNYEEFVRRSADGGLRRRR